MVSGNPVNAHTSFRSGPAPDIFTADITEKRTMAVTGRQFVSTCGYCGGPGTTKEHIFGRWAVRRIGLTPHTKVIHSVYQSSTPGPVSRPGSPRSLSLKIACKTCNNHWMGDIQDSARPIIERIAKGDWFQPSGEERLALARWAVLVVMSWQFAHLETMTITTSERKHYSESDSVPADWRIWIGRFQERGDLDGSITHDAYVAIDENEERHGGAIATFIIGELLIHAIKGPIEDLINIRTYSNFIPLQQIWPFSAIQGPKRVPVLKDEHVREFIAAYRMMVRNFAESWLP